MESQRVGHDWAALTSHISISRKRVEFLYKNIWNNFKMHHIFYHEMNLNKFQTIKDSKCYQTCSVCVCACVCVSVCLQFGKLSSVHRTGKGQFSFQFQRRVMPKNVQATIQLSSFHMLARLCSKSFMIVLSSSWTENFQVGKLGFAEAAELEIKLPIFFGSWRKQGSPRAHLLLFHWLCWSRWMCGSQQTEENS